MSVATPVERPKRVRRRRVKPRGEVCLNCGAEVSSAFCPECGQENTPPDVSLAAVLREFLSELVHFESKLWLTLRTLVAHPGRLTTEWSLGRRTKFLSPVRLYLTVTFLFFLGVAWHGAQGVNIKSTLSAKDKAEMIKSLSKQKLTHNARMLAEKQISRFDLTPGDAKEIGAALDQGEKNEAAAVAANKDDQPIIQFGPLGALNGRKGWFAHQMDKLTIAAKDDPSAVNRSYVDQIPKTLFIMLPLCAVILKLLYLRQRRTFVEHLVFLLHFHSFAFLVLLPEALFPNNVFSVVTVFVVLFWTPIYAFIALLRYYGQPWWLTIIKSFFLGFAYLLLVAAGALIALLMYVVPLPDAPSTPSTSKSQIQQPAGPPVLQKSDPPAAVNAR